MDFWDLTKLLFRRWYFAAPLLLLSGLAVLWTSAHVAPKYLANSWIQVVPPTVVSQPKAGETTVPVNPWLNLGLQALANAATVQVQDEATLNGENFTVTVSGANSTIHIEMVGDSREQARARSDAVVGQIEQRIKDLQASYSVPQSDLITSKRLDLGTNIEKSNGNVNKAIIVVAAVCLLFTIAATIGFDALMRRRARRQSGGGDADIAFTPAVDRPVSPPVSPAVSPAILPSPVRDGMVPVGADSGRREAFPVPTRFPTVVAPAAPIGATPQLPAERSADSEIASDSTIILPLSTFKRQ